MRGGAGIYGLTEQDLMETGCIFRWRTIQCKDHTKCETCGWNPSVEAERKRKAAERTKAARRRRK